MLVLMLESLLQSLKNKVEKKTLKVISFNLSNNVRIYIKGAKTFGFFSVLVLD